MFYSTAKRRSFVTIPPNSLVFAIDNDAPIFEVPIVPPLPDGRDSRTYLEHLLELETQAKAARRGAWGKLHP